MSKLFETENQSEARALFLSDGIRPFLDHIGYDVQSDPRAQQACAKLSVIEQWACVDDPGAVNCIVGMLADWRVQCLAMVQMFGLCAESWALAPVELITKAVLEPGKPAALGILAALVRDHLDPVFMRCGGVSVRGFRQLSQQGKVNLLLTVQPEGQRTMLLAQCLDLAAEAVFHRVNECCPWETTQDCLQDMFTRMMTLLFNEAGMKDADAQTPEGLALKQRISERMRSMATVELITSGWSFPRGGANAQAN